MESVNPRGKQIPFTCRRRYVGDSFRDVDKDDTLPGAGIGVCCSVSLENRLNVGLDWAIGKDNDSVYIYVGEAF